MSVLTRPILEIDLNNLVENYKMLQKLAPKSASAAVVKTMITALTREL